MEPAGFSLREPERTSPTDVRSGVRIDLTRRPPEIAVGSMATIDTYRPEDARAIAAMYRRVFGNDEAEGNRLRWDWQYRRNPNCPPEGPQIWVAREGPTVIGQYATMPVRLVVNGHEISASFGMDVMVVPERQRQGLGEVLFRTWDQHVGAALGLRAPADLADAPQPVRVGRHAPHRAHRLTREADGPRRGPYQQLR